MAHFTGKTWDELYSGPTHGYVKEGIPAEFHQTTWCTDKTIEFIKERAGGQPWLLSFNCFDPHHPFDPPAEYLNRYDPAEMALPKFREGELAGKPQFQRADHTEASDGLFNYDFTKMTDDQKRQIIAAYYAMIKLVDHSVGRMVAALEETGQRQNTIVIFMSDHGELLGDHGIFLKGPHFYEESVRVPVVMSCPGLLAQDVRADGLIELIDLAPTLLECAGIEIPPAMQGRSIKNILTGQADPSHHRDFVFSEYYNSWSHPHSYGTMFRTRDKKIAVYHGDHLDVAGELYDLAADPDEYVNLWDDPGSAALKMDLMKRGFDASVFTMDPMPPRIGAF
jgi:arylsulfatase